jgi:hypothetical protein
VVALARFLLVEPQRNAAVNAATQSGRRSVTPSARHQECTPRDGNGFWAGRSSERGLHLVRLDMLAANPGATRSPHAAPSRQGQSVARIMLLPDSRRLGYPSRGLLRSCAKSVAPRVRRA